jgi:hypothetical protein
VGFSGGIPVGVVTTPLVYQGWITATCSHRNSTVFGTTSGKAQLHCSKSGETFFLAISISHTESKDYGW